MLVGNEKKVMDVIFKQTSNKGSCLITPTDLINMVGGKQPLKLSEVEKVLKTLEYDDYIDVVYSDRHGETVYCITLHAKGEAYNRSKVVNKRNLAFRIGLTVALAVLSFTISLILKNCISC